MMYLVITSLLILILYVTTVCRKYNGVPPSISSTYYTLKHKFWFGFSMVVSSILSMPAIIDISDPNIQFLSFFACIGMILVGLAPNFKDKFEHKIHATGAVMTLLSSQMWVGFTDPFFLISWIPYIIGTLIISYNRNKDNMIEAIDSTNPLFWVEVLCIVNTYSLLVLNYILK